MKNKKLVFVLGGVMSGVGKGVATGIMASLIEGSGYKVNVMKVDTYINVDAGTMHPTEHGEVFVLGSGLECDQDMGNYERFLDKDFSNEDYLTSGMIYKSVIDRERSLGYDGKCVEAIPHITNEIMDRFKLSFEKSGADIQFVEIGGTVGDFQNTLFYEAIGRTRCEKGIDVYVVILVPFPTPDHLGEMKTKPAQTAIRMLSSFGINPNVIIARAHKELDEKRKEKIANMCLIDKKNIISAPDVDNIFNAIIDFKHKRKLDEIILEMMDLPKIKEANISNWEKFYKKSNELIYEINIAIAGKYFDSGSFVLSDAYHSVINALKFSGIHEKTKINISYINTKDFEGNNKNIKELDKYHAIIVPGGFGNTGIDGKLNIIRYVRENNIPYLGICYGAQLAVIEFARNVLNIKDADSVERDKETKNPVVNLLTSQEKSMQKKDYGGTMRLGNKEIKLKKDTLIHTLYEKKDTCIERHRHRYFINTDYMDKLEENGMIVSGISKSTSGDEIIESLEIKNHPYFIAVQYHPEFTARPFKPNPLFTGLVKSAKNRKGI